MPMSKCLDHSGYGTYQEWRYRNFRTIYGLPREMKDVPEALKRSADGILVKIDGTYFDIAICFGGGWCSSDGREYAPGRLTGWWPLPNNADDNR